MPFSQLIRKVSYTGLMNPAVLCSTHLYATNCWSCKRLFDEKQSKKLICPCSKELIQPVNSTVNYFEVFNMPLGFNIDQKQLTQSFRNLMRVLHPDKFTNNSETEKLYSADQSSFVNNAYKTLSNDLDRAFYLLKVKGYYNKNVEDSQMDHEFLIDIMEMNERASDIKSANEVRAFEAEIVEYLKVHTLELSKAFEKDDFDMAHRIANKLRFYRNLHETMKEMKLKFGLQD